MWTPDLAGRNSLRYLAIVEALADDIARVGLRLGERLPTHRVLAWRLGVNTSTVSQAYREAVRRHLVSGEVGRGTYVLAGSREAGLFAFKAGAETEPALIDLSTNVPALDPDSPDLPDTLAALAKEGALGAAAMGYHAPALLARARLAGAPWLAARGLHLRPADVVPCAGAQSALLAVLLALCAPGDAVLAEELTFPGMKAAARQLRLPLHAIEMDGEGVLPEALDRAAPATGAKVAVLVPTLQNPTGAVISEARRRAVAEVARLHGLWVVEDDVYGALAGQLPLMAEVACRWIKDGTAARRLAWQYAEVVARQALARRILDGMGACSAPASPHFWLPLASGADQAATRCRAAGVAVVASPLFAVTREAPEGVRVSLAAARSRAELSQALVRLRDCDLAYVADA